MMIRRNVRDRLRALAGFITWDPDPYLVLTEAGRLVWIVDGYTTSAAHPYSRAASTCAASGSVNYIRNSVKATVDAYDGDDPPLHLRPRRPHHPAYQQHLPRRCSSPPRRCPPTCARTRATPRRIFRVQAEIYRTYHMLDPQAFYNKEDLWDIARYTSRARTATPAAASPRPTWWPRCPARTQPEFLLIMPFTPRNKDNMIGLMVARCDGEHLGELVFLQLSKQELIFGPMQIEARINQDQNISKDLIAVEPAGLAGAARPDAGAAGGGHVPLRGAASTSRPPRRACRS